MGRRNLMKAGVFVVVAFAAVLIAGSVMASGPSEETIAAGRVPTTTTTTEPPPEGVVIVRLSNGTFRPSNLRVNLDEIQIVQWINEDPREYIIRAAGMFESEPLAQGDTFEFDYSTVEPAIHRYEALIGFQRIPGSVDTRPEQ